MHKKNKIISIIIFVLSLLLIILGIVLTILNNNTKEKTLYYHCESDLIEEKHSNFCKYSLNYDFIYEDNKIVNYSNYFKLVFDDKEKYNNFKGVNSNDAVSLGDKSKQDDKTLTRYYSYSYIEESDSSDIDKYISTIEKKHKLKCTKKEYRSLILFD